MEKTRDATVLPAAGLSVTPPIPDDLRQRPITLTDNARVVLQKRYLRRGSDGKPAENEQEMFWRVAYNVALAEDKHNGDVIKNARRFYDLLTNLQFFPNSPTFTGAGTPLGQLAACFTEDMRVTTSVGLKRIADLLTGDLVLTHKGHYRPVTEVYKREYSDTLLEIKIKKLGTPLKVTPEHPILTSRGWVKAGELKVGDWVAAGVPQGIWENSVFDLAALEFPVELELQHTESTVRVRRPSTYQNSGLQARWVSRFVEPTPELARLCGYYVSEGTLGTECEYLRFTFSKDEEDYHQDVVNLIERVFGATATVRPSNHGHWVQIDVYSRAIAMWFKANFGTHSYGKYLPAWLQFMPAEHQKQFLIGILRGDGLFYEKKQPNGVKFRTLRLTLSNPSLISQVWQMCLRYGFDASIRPCDTTYVTPNARDTASINIPPYQAQDFVEDAFGHKFSPMDMRYTRSDVSRIDGQPFFQIKSIASSTFTGLVYNCEVEEDHTYVTEGVVVHNCFVLRIDDDMGRSDTGIFQTLRNAALIQQTGGGNGFAFSRLRPKGAIVKSSNGQATGPVGFLRVYDQAFGEIAQGGSRRGANMAVLKVDHPDVREFITCKTDESNITNFNISVGITDAFMRAVETDSTYDLINPQDGKVWETVRAREIFDLIVKQAHHNGEPGVLFLDAANRQNPVPHLYELESTNPCGEQFLGPFENCCLGSINLVNVNTPDGKVNWAQLQELVETSTRFLDDVVTANKYVPAVPQLEEAAHAVRRIGLGIMGLGDLMYKCGIRYGSEEGQEFAGQVMEFVRFHAMKTSIALAQERGAFPAIKGSIYDPENMKWQPPTPLFPYSRNLHRPALDWSEIVAGIKQYGIRNGCQTTVAPTGTIATVSGCEAYGCEPVFALAYIRHVNDKGQDLKLQYTSPLFQKALEDAGLDAAQIKTIVEQVNIAGSCQNVPGVPENVRHTFVVSADVSVEEHIRMQAAMQAFVDNAISKTVNAPDTATLEDVKTAYMMGWKLGCKGMTVYVTGSREKVVLETHATAQAKQKDEQPTQAAIVAAPVPAVSQPAPMKIYGELKKARARRLAGRTYQIGTPVGKTYITINENGEGRGQPFEIFTHTSKAGSETAAVSEAIGRLISLVLRIASPISPRERLGEIVQQLVGIGGGRSSGFGAARVRSLPDGVAQALQEYLEETSDMENLEEPVEITPLVTNAIPANAQSSQAPALKSAVGVNNGKIVGDLCPECGEATLINEEGCRKCYTCSYSEC